MLCSPVPGSVHCPCLCPLDFEVVLGGTTPAVVPGLCDLLMTAGGVVLGTTAHS